MLAEINGFLDWCVSISSQHYIHFLWRPLLRDPKDGMVLEEAVAADSKYLSPVQDFGFRWRCLSWCPRHYTATTSRIDSILTTMSTLSIRLPNSIHQDAELGKKVDIDAILNRVPAVEPEPHDRILD